MCTVSYIPTQEGFILTSNRDEAPDRATSDPETWVLPGGTRVIAPRDKAKGGTWISLDEKGRVACLLNGAFGRHMRTPPYRISRGQLILEALDANDFGSFMGGVELQGIEPFTLLLMATGQLYKLVWDGLTKFYWELPSGTRHLWSSPTLYNPVQHAAKEFYFTNALTLHGKGPEDLLRIHGRDTETPFILNRPEVRTVSITQVLIENGKGHLQYHLKDQLNDKAILVSSAVL